MELIKKINNDIVTKDIVKVEGNSIETFPAHYDHKTIGDNKVETIKTTKGEISFWHLTRYFTGFDMDILVAIGSLFKKNRENRRFTALPLDIIKELGLSNSPFNKSMVKKSIDEIAGTTIHYNGSWRASDGIFRATGRFALISYRFVTKYDL